MGAGNNRLYYLPARIARFEFIFLVEFKLSSNSRARAPARGPLGYACCPVRPRVLPRRPRRRAASRPVPPRIVSFPSDFAVYQRVYKKKSPPSRSMEGPSPRFSEFRCAGGLLATGGQDDTEWYEFYSYGQSKNTNICTIIYSHSIVAGGLGVTSYTTRFTPGTSATMRLEMRPITS